MKQKSLEEALINAIAAEMRRTAKQVRKSVDKSLRVTEKNLLEIRRIRKVAKAGADRR